MLLLDIAVQCGQAANQARIFALRGEVRARLNTAYMTCPFLGASAGSWVGVRAYTAIGWLGISALVALAAAVALLRHQLSSMSMPPRSPTRQAGIVIADTSAGCRGCGRDQPTG